MIETITVQFDRCTGTGGKPCLDMVVEDLSGGVKIIRHQQSWEIDAPDTDGSVVKVSALMLESLVKELEAK